MTKIHDNGKNGKKWQKNGKKKGLTWIKLAK
jgi:hypothetical protein